MLVRVTESDIARGKPDHSCECPIALAIRAMGYDVSVGTYSIEVREDGVVVHDALLLPPSAVAFIDYFDSGKPVSPFEFEIDIDE